MANIDNSHLENLDTAGKIAVLKETFPGIRAAIIKQALYTCEGSAMFAIDVVLNQVFQGEDIFKKNTQAFKESDLATLPWKDKEGKKHVTFAENPMPKSGNINLDKSRTLKPATKSSPTHSVTPKIRGKGKKKWAVGKSSPSKGGVQAGHVNGSSDVATAAAARSSIGSSSSGSSSSSCSSSSSGSSSSSSGSARETNGKVNWKGKVKKKVKEKGECKTKSKSSNRPPKKKVLMMI